MSTPASAAGGLCHAVPAGLGPRKRGRVCRVSSVSLCLSVNTNACEQDVSCPGACGEGPSSVSEELDPLLRAGITGTPLCIPSPCNNYDPPGAVPRTPSVDGIREHLMHLPPSGTHSHDVYLSVCTTCLYIVRELAHVAIGPGSHAGATDHHPIGSLGW